MERFNMNDFKPGIYKHFKGNYYKALYLANDSETCEKVVVYQALYGEKELWVRPLKEWQEIVTLPNGEKVDRFTFISND